MALKGLQSKINVLETVRQKVPGRRTGIDKRLSPVRGRLTWGSPVLHDQPSVSDGGQERWARVGRMSTGIKTPCSVDTCTRTLTLNWTRRRRPANEAPRVGGTDSALDRVLETIRSRQREHAARSSVSETSLVHVR